MLFVIVREWKLLLIRLLLLKKRTITKIRSNRYGEKVVYICGRQHHPSIKFGRLYRGTSLKSEKYYVHHYDLLVVDFETSSLKEAVDKAIEIAEAE